MKMSAPAKRLNSAKAAKKTKPSPTVGRVCQTVAKRPVTHQETREQDEAIAQTQLLKFYRETTVTFDLTLIEQINN